MIPIGDINPRRHLPLITILIILANFGVFLYQLVLPEAQYERFIATSAMIPYRITQDWSLASSMTLFSAMFMHGGWLHILGNMLYLWIFGDNIEECFGGLGYLIFYLMGGLVAAAAQIAIDPLGRTPTLGASGAIAAVLGAYLVLYPRRRVRTLIFVFYFIRYVELPAILVLGFWFILQLFNGVAAIGSTATGVAWFAHIGGFVFGLLIAAGYKAVGAQRYARNCGP